MKVQHVASKPDGLVQECSRCGENIVDLRGAMMEVGQCPVFWAEGPVYVDGNCWMGVEPRFGDFEKCSTPAEAALRGQRG